ncbi:MAG TPA: right-handed parallel beta-helix repeat-containing protein, partial [bacterium]|nr:right-handed parallel beta-helix repeat-containing protein [bacterium]
MDTGARYFRPFYGFLLVFAVLTALTTRLEAADVCVDDVSDGAADALDCDADCSDPSPDCSLRDAIDKAGTGDRIFFDPSLSGNSIGLTEGNYLISSDLTIEGPGSGNFTISGADDFQIFNLQATVQISGLKMINGRNDGIGGCVFISGSGNVTLDDVIVTNCEIATSGSAGGAGIYNEGSLTITNSTIRDSKLALGSSGSIVGGGIQNTGSLTIRNSSIFGNVAQLGGGIFSGGSTASLILDKVSVTTNISQANDSGGGGIAVSGAGSSAVLTNVTFSGNVAFGTNTIGGGISVNNQGHATLIHCTLAENAADNGGNIGNFNNGTATLVNTLIANDTEGGGCVGDVTNDGG